MINALLRVVETITQEPPRTNRVGLQRPLHQQIERDTDRMEQAQIGQNINASGTACHALRQ